MDSLFFYYNGRKSEDLGVYLINTESGLKKTPFLAEKEIVSEKIPGNPIPYVYGTDYNPLSFPLTLANLDGGKWTLEKRREVARWLNTNSFEEFYTTDQPDKRYYLQYSGGIEFTHNGLGDGYITVEMQSMAPYAFSPYQQDRYDLSDIISPTVIEFENNGDVNLQPELWITKFGNGDLSIRNLSKSGETFTFTNLYDQEGIYVDNKDRHIETDLINFYRYDSFNGKFLELVRGKNRLEITGACQLLFKYQYVILG
jgi:phage-related protein